MNISYDELRKIKHALPTGSVAIIASKLNIDEQTVRNYFGAQKYASGDVVDTHIQPGPNGGVVTLQNTEILDLAKAIIKEAKN